MIAARRGGGRARRWHGLGRDFGLPRSPVALGGAHQRGNAAIAVALARAAAASLGSRWTTRAIASGLAERAAGPGGSSAVADDVLLDCAHNVEAARGAGGGAADDRCAAAASCC